jgi:hypothetical protein
VNCYGAQFDKNPLGLAPVWVDNPEMHIHLNVDQAFQNAAGVESVHPLTDPDIESLWLWKPFGMNRTPHPSGKARRYFSLPQNMAQQIGVRYFTELCKIHGKRAVLYTGPTIDGIDEGQHVTADAAAMTQLDALGFDEIYFDDAHAQASTVATLNRRQGRTRLGVEPTLPHWPESQSVPQCALERYRGAPWRTPGSIGHMRKLSIIIDGSKIGPGGEKQEAALTDDELDDYAARRWNMVGLAIPYRVRVVEAVRRANARAEAKR